MSSGGVLSRVLLLIGGLLLFGSTTSGLDSDTSTARSTTVASSSFNLTSYDVLDVRTPPRIKLREKTKRPKPSKPLQDTSHPGVAIPLDAKVEVSRDKSTTSWILLTGKTVPTSTTKSTKVPTQMQQTVPASTTKIPAQTQPEPTGKQPTEAPIEAKEASINLETPVNSTKKPQVSTNKNKKKKNKTRKRKPQGTGTTDPIQLKETIGNQFYSYLSREVVPTLGVGLVGLVVTAGLAGYFLYHPFGALAKSDAPAIDRAGHQYRYRDRYYGGVPEEEAIGEVIAGMTDGNKPAIAGKKKYRLDEYRAGYGGSTERGEGLRVDGKNGGYRGSGDKSKGYQVEGKGDSVEYRGDYGGVEEGSVKYRVEGKNGGYGGSGEKSDGYQVEGKGDLVEYRGDYEGDDEGGVRYRVEGKMGDSLEYRGGYEGSVEGSDKHQVKSKGDMVKYRGDYGESAEGSQKYGIEDKGDLVKYRGDYGGFVEGREGYRVGGKIGDSLEYRGDYGGSTERVEGKVGEMGAMRITEHGPRSLD